MEENSYICRVTMKEKYPELFPDDPSIIRAVRRGDPKVFSHLFDVYYKDLVMYASSFCSNKDLCEDIVQDLFADLYVRHGRFDPHCSVKAYFLTTVRNACLDELRHRKVRTNHADYMLRFGLKVSENVEDHLMYSELKEALAKAMNKLSDKERTCFTMNKIHGMTTSEISQALQMPLRTVQHHIFKAVEKIMRQIPVTITVFAVLIALRSVLNVFNLI